MNKRITSKERGLLKGAIRRVFSRSDLRKEALEKVKIEHKDPKRLRVSKWGKCPICKMPEALYLFQVDHRVPIVPLDRSLEEMTWDEVVDRTWCPIENLQAICKPCHKIKTKEEAKERKKNKKGKSKK